LELKHRIVRSGSLHWGKPPGDRRPIAANQQVIRQDLRSVSTTHRIVESATDTAFPKTMDNAELHFCPCCGYAGLAAPAYAKLGPPPWNHPGPPPYEQWYGLPSYEVCACCGFEFGNDDNPGTAAPSSFEKYQREWIDKGCPWFRERNRPAGWQLADQLRAAGSGASK
jgi:hypothetical protein